MTEPTDTPDTAVPPAADSFQAAMALIELAINPRELQGRLADLKATEDRVAKELRRLELARQSHERAIAKDRAEIQEERRLLAERLRRVEEGERSLEASRERIAQFKREQDARRYERLPGGGLRDHGPDGLMHQPRPLDDPHFDPARLSAALDDTTEVEKVPGAGHTLSRSIPKRRTMRRGADAP